MSRQGCETGRSAGISAPRPESLPEGTGSREEQPTAMSAHQSPTESGGQPPSECNSASANASACLYANASADDPDVFRLGSLLALRNVELDLLPFVDAAVATTRDRAEVHEHVRATLDLDEAVALVTVKPLHSALRHLDLLRCGRGAPGHGGQRAATIRASLSGNARGVNRTARRAPLLRRVAQPLQRTLGTRKPGPVRSAPARFRSGLRTRRCCASNCRLSGRMIHHR